MDTCAVTSLYILSDISVHPAPESTASDPNPRLTFMAKISLDFCRYVAYLTAHIEREPRQPAWFGKVGFPSSFSTLDEAVARKPFLAMTTINVSLVSAPNESVPTLAVADVSPDTEPEHVEGIGHTFLGRVSHQCFAKVFFCGSIEQGTSRC
jgi:hypothetical protein